MNLCLADSDRDARMPIRESPCSDGGKMQGPEWPALARNPKFHRAGAKDASRRLAEHEAR